jgi:hypothetical protein
VGVRGHVSAPGEDCRTLRTHTALPPLRSATETVSGRSHADSRPSARHGLLGIDRYPLGAESQTAYRGRITRDWRDPPEADELRKLLAAYWKAEDSLPPRVIPATASTASRAAQGRHHRPRRSWLLWDRVRPGKRPLRGSQARGMRRFLQHRQESVNDPDYAEEGKR